MIEEAERASDLSVSVSVRALGERDGALFEHAPDRFLRTASSAKVAVLIAAASALAHGEIVATDLLDRASVEEVRDSGIWWHLDQKTMAFSDAAKLVGTVSDNLATNCLIVALGGIERIGTVAREFGVRDVALNDIVRDAREAHHPATLSVGTASGYASIFSLLRQRALADDPVAQQVLDWLSDGMDLSMVLSGFGLDPLAHHEPDRGVTVINKTGTDVGVRADSGLVNFRQTSVAYSCLINWSPDGSECDHRRDDALRLMRAVGDLVRAKIEQSSGSGV
ncbi:MAG: serine hydrolase [Microbacterium sp.]